MQDKTNILSTIEFYKKDLPKQVSWNEITALSDLLLGVEFLPNRTVTVQCKSDADSKQTFILPCLTKSHFSTGDCTIGRVIRRNKVAFHVWRESEKY